MKILKKYNGIGLIVLLAIFSCKSVHRLAVPMGTENSIDLPEKKSYLTKEQEKTWYLEDLQRDTLPGMSVARAYEFLKGRKNIPVIVAVADSGIDLNHEDLKEVLWKNPNEVDNNQKDDDGNGFIDDVHGWNFLGEVYRENLEITRLIKKYDARFKNIPKENVKDTVAYKEYLELKDTFEEKAHSNKKRTSEYNKMLMQLEKVNHFLVKKTGKENYTLKDIEAIKSEEKTNTMAIMMATSILKQGYKIKALMEDLEMAIANSTDFHYDLNFNPRKEILKDDENNFGIKVYGNNKPIPYGKHEFHGTHVAGIILAQNDNQKGINGVAKNAVLMAVRVVPDGDEYDKDVANGIRYAVDNGAKIINMSFGKGYSPNKEEVFQAIKYAAQKDVLIVNAAGNDALDMDVKKAYPNDSEDLQNEFADNVLTIGAIGYFYNEKIVARFSNYGKKNVDIFAPGVKIYSTVPKNDYKPFQGTSMAAPSAAGVAAILRSYFPELSASQVKHIIMNSGTKIPFKVIKPGTSEKVLLTDLCVSGRIVNAYNAVRMAVNMLEK